MAKDCRSFDVAIVGGGVLGTMVAVEANKIGKGLKTVCFRLPDTGRPRAESLRNQGWLQSGQRYLRHEEIEKSRLMAERMWLAGRRLQEFDMRQAASGESLGVVQMNTAEEAEFLENAKAFGQDKKVRLLARGKAQEELGKFWDPNGICYEVPEQHLNFARVMHQARAIAIAQNNVQFREVSSVEVLPRPSYTPSIRLIVNGAEVEAKVVIFAAGCGNVRFLNELTPGHEYKLQQTPLLVVKGEPAIKRPVFYCRIHGRSIVAHHSLGRASEGCMIIGTSTKGPIAAFCEPEKRYVEPCDVKKILDSLDRELQLRKPPRRYRFTAGWEPIPGDDKDVKPQVFDIPQHGHGDVIFAFCGRATFVLPAAELVTDMARAILNKIRVKRSAGQTIEAHDSTAAECDIGKPWDDDIYMHHEGIFTFSDDEPLHTRK